jgi:hypothetical protein
MKVAGIPPTSTSMFNNICYELVAELADGIPDIASNIRKKLDLPEKVLEFKENATRDLVYTTGPDLSIWRYDPHLLQIGGPPVEYAEQVMIVDFVTFLPSLCHRDGASLSLSLSLSHTHTHTHSWMQHADTCVSSGFRSPETDWTFFSV